MADDTVVTTPQADATPSAPAPAAATPAAPAAPAVAATSTPAAPQAPATGAPGDGWVPSYRLREAREAAERTANESFSRKEAELRSELNKVQQQLRSLVGVSEPQNPEVDAVRKQFGQLYPGLAKLEERAAQLEELLGRAEDLNSQSEHYWQQYGRQTMDRLFDLASKSLGAPLTEEGKRNLHASFSGFVQSSPELTQRYASDPGLVEEFWQAFTSSFIDPARRAASATVQTRTAPALPQDRGGSVPPVTPGPKPANIDERAAAAWAQYQQTAKT